MAKPKKPLPSFIACLLKALPEAQHVAAAATAINENPANAPVPMVMALTISTMPDLLPAQRIAVLTTKFWGSGGVKLGVAFLDGGSSDLRARIISHMNAWGETANVKFLPASAGMAQVRIMRRPMDGYWSYLGTDILHLPKEQPTMNLDSFSMTTAEAEYRRVVRHETGHTLGCPHEHMRQAIINRLDRQKTITYFQQNYGWSAADTISQVLTPVEESALIATPATDEVSIMTYSLPSSITKDGRPVVGGSDIDPLDASFMARLYPGAVAPPPPPSGLTVTLGQDLKAGTYTLSPGG